MIQKARASVAAEKRNSSRGRKSRSRSSAKAQESPSLPADRSTENTRISNLAPLLQRAGGMKVSDGVEGVGVEDGGEKPSMAMAKSTRQEQLLYQATPYASMVGVVGLGILLMAYLNGWQKGER